jgi:hypothetical protein
LNPTTRALVANDDLDAMMPKKKRKPNLGLDAVGKAKTRTNRLIHVADDEAEVEAGMIEIRRNDHRLSHAKKVTIGKKSKTIPKTQTKTATRAKTKTHGKTCGKTEMIAVDAVVHEVEVDVDADAVAASQTAMKSIPIATI